MTSGVTSDTSPIHLGRRELSILDRLAKVRRRIIETLISDAEFEGADERNTITYALDFDQVFQYMYPSDMRARRAVASREFFESGERRYALPGGAIIELYRQLGEDLGRLQPDSRLQGLTQDLFSDSQLRAQIDRYLSVRVNDESIDIDTFVPDAEIAGTAENALAELRSYAQSVGDFSAGVNRLVRVLNSDRLVPLSPAVGSRPLTRRYQEMLNGDASDGFRTLRRYSRMADDVAGPSIEDSERQQSRRPRRRRTWLNDAADAYNLALIRAIRLYGLEHETHHCVYLLTDTPAVFNPELFPSNSIVDSVLERMDHLRSSTTAAIDALVRQSHPDPELRARMLEDELERTDEAASLVSRRLRESGGFDARFTIHDRDPWTLSPALNERVQQAEDQIWDSMFRSPLRSTEYFVASAKSTESPSWEFDPARWSTFETELDIYRRAEVVLNEYRYARSLLRDFVEESRVRPRSTFNFHRWLEQHYVVDDSGFDDERFAGLVTVRVDASVDTAYTAEGVEASVDLSDEVLRCTPVNAEWLSAAVPTLEQLLEFEDSVLELRETFSEEHNPKAMLVLNRLDTDGAVEDQWFIVDSARAINDQVMSVSPDHRVLGVKVFFEQIHLFHDFVMLHDRETELAGAIFTGLVDDGVVAKFLKTNARTPLASEAYEALIDRARQRIYRGAS